MKWDRNDGKLAAESISRAATLKKSYENVPELSMIALKTDTSEIVNVLHLRLSFCTEFSAFPKRGMRFDRRP